MLQSEDESSQMETDDNDEIEQDISEQSEYAATGSGSDIKTTQVRESLLPSKSSYKQQKQTLSSVIPSPAVGRNVRLTSNDRTSSLYTGPSVEPRRRSTALQIREENIQERQQKLLLTSNMHHISIPSAVNDTRPELINERRELSSSKLCSLLKCFVATSIFFVVSAFLMAVLVTTGEEPYYSRWLESFKKLQSLKPGTDDMASFNGYIVCETS